MPAYDGTKFDIGVREAVPGAVDDALRPDAPRLGPDSLVWKFYGDIRVTAFGFQRPAATENCIEQLAQGVEDHSVIFSDLRGRGARTIPPIMETVYSEDPYGTGRRVRDFHKTIKGTIADGSRYHALNPELFYWAHATFVDQVIYMADTFIRRLSYEEKKQIFEESRTWYELYGVSSRNQPGTYEEFLSYWDAMTARFAPTRVVRYGTGYLRKGLPRPKQAAAIPTPVWRALTAAPNAFLRMVGIGTLPPEARAACDLAWDDEQERRFQRFAAFMRALNPLFNRLPVGLLYLPWAARAWKRHGVDPRRIHNRPPTTTPAR
ncbi:oxygenase MpaB family protein [Nocardia higoensis]|uniref:oxygenase MpaB family protein n=1 Tax=Nocardia higoensis TaxID=228599 RepID=UPI0002E578C2|nr:oxygenase MpaB family protein [Nocardia higoensis]